MSESKLRELSMEFSVEIIELVKYLKSIKESIISNQIGRSGTSIGANIHEAQYAQGKKDFISKLEIALKEASETGYWLELLYETNSISKKESKINSIYFGFFNKIYFCTVIVGKMLYIRINNFFIHIK